MYLLHEQLARAVQADRLREAEQRRHVASVPPRNPSERQRLSELVRKAGLRPAGQLPFPVSG